MRYYAAVACRKSLARHRATNTMTTMYMVHASIQFMPAVHAEPGDRLLLMCLLLVAAAAARGAGADGTDRQEGEGAVWSAHHYT